jgi:hypothetical protein
MDTFMVGYDLNSPGQNYDKLIEALKGYPNWWHHLDSTWFIKSSDSAVTIRDALVKHIDTGDELLVVKVTGAFAAWRGFNDKGSQWLKDNL